jgi:hypothetical protein
MVQIGYLVTDSFIDDTLAISNTKIINSHKLLKIIEDHFEIAEDEFTLKNDMAQFMNENNIEFYQIIEQLKSYSLILYRGLLIDSKYEIDFRTHAYFIIFITKYLKDNEIGALVFNSGMSHHMNFVLFEIAARLIGIPQIFLYNLFPSNRLLPLIQVDGIKDRKPLNLEVSEFNHNVDFIEFNKPNNLRTQPAAHPNPAKHILNFKINLIRPTLAEMYFHKKNRKEYSKLIYKKSVSYNEDVKIAKRQIKALKYLNQKIRKNDKILNNLLSDLKNKKQKAIIFYGHLQPEATSFPEAWENANLVDAIFKIRESGFNGILFYKEHFASYDLSYSEGIFGSKYPTRVGIFKSVEFYKQLEKLGCVFIDNTSTYFDEITKNSLVATLTGTIALERSFQGRYTFILGYPWFQVLPGCLRVNKENIFRFINDEIDVQESLSLAEINMDIYLKNCNRISINNFEVEKEDFHIEMNRFLTKLKQFLF